LNVADEGYSRNASNVADECYSRNASNVADGGYSRNASNVADEGYSRNASCTLHLTSKFYQCSIGKSHKKMCIVFNDCKVNREKIENVVIPL